MITAQGYSNDPGIVPEGIVLTMPLGFFADRDMTYDEFRIEFEGALADEEGTWNFTLTNLPKQEVPFVYIVFEKKIQYRCNLVCYERNKTKIFRDAPDKKRRAFLNKNWVILSGPAVRAPRDIVQRGFQGFRYCTKLF